MYFLYHMIQQLPLFTKPYILFRINVNPYPPNFENISCIIVKIIKFKLLSLMSILIFNVQMQPQITLDIIFQIYKRNFTVRKRDVIPCVMVPWHISFVWHIIFPLIAKFFDVVSHIFKLKRFNCFKFLAPFTSLN